MKLFDYLIQEKISEHPLDWRCTKCGNISSEPIEKYKKGTTIKKHCPICHPFSKRKTEHTIIW